jgi:hypothetical protein
LKLGKVVANISITRSRPSVLSLFHVRTGVSEWSTTAVISMLRLGK